MESPATDVYLRAMEPADAEITHPWRADPEISDMVVGPRRYISLATERDWVNRMIVEHQKGTQQRWSVCLKEDGKMIGMGNLNSIDSLNRSAVMGIMIGHKEYWGKGVAKAAYRFMLDHAFQQLNINSIRCNVLSSNLSSIRLHEGMGFIKEGTLRQAIFKNGQFHSIINYSMLKEEFDILRKSWQK